MDLDSSLRGSFSREGSAPGGKSRESQHDRDHQRHRSIKRRENKRHRRSYSRSQNRSRSQSYTPPYSRSYSRSTSPEGKSQTRSKDGSIERVSDINDDGTHTRGESKVDQISDELAREARQVQRKISKNPRPGPTKTADPNSSKENPESNDNRKLNTEYLEILGDDPTTIKDTKSLINKDLLTRSSKWITTSLKKEIKEKLLKDYPNVEGITPQALNRKFHI
ncbi:uncharacterized protein LOC127284550 [Leptopilina boulardi]|uniref:uncharacterized protein LOC127284550 n=1 Tax=Leptopilina boulardi TaxID=63433 RepID=UPI0021F52297|nr:uncharacterized protein LOC127284550 [Leptopilina boulardi]